MKNTFGNIFPFTMGVGTGKKGESQEEKEDNEEQVDFGSQVSLNSSTQENEAYATERLEPWPVKRLCEYDKFGDANRGEYKHRARQRIGGPRGG